MDWVVDTSFTAALFLPDEHSKIVDDFFAAILPTERLLVPNLWRYEISNVIVTCLKQRRLTKQQSIKILEYLDEIPFISCGITSHHSLINTALTYQLSAYDAAYLELALEQTAGLASFDEELIEAAKKVGIEIATRNSYSVD